MPNQGDINSPFDDSVTPFVDKGDSSNVTLVDGEPGYKKATPSPNAPSRTHRHATLDGGSSPDLTDSQSPDTVHKRVK